MKVSMVLPILACAAVLTCAACPHAAANAAANAAAIAGAKALLAAREDIVKAHDKKVLEAWRLAAGRAIDALSN